MHIVDPETHPLSADAVYTPKAHTLEEAQDFENSVGLDNIVIVQPSIYGTDNSCLLSALRALGPNRARGVVVFDPTSISAQDLRDWHAAGVRGARLNLMSQGRPPPNAEELTRLLHGYADALRPMGWVLQIYAPLQLMNVLERLIPDLGVRVVIDHMGGPSLSSAPAGVEPLDPYDMPGFASLVNLLRAGQTFVKLSAPYRNTKAKDYGDLEPLQKELLRVAGKNRVVFATDWPHTRFEGLDIRPWVERVFEMCAGDAVLIDRIFRGNAEDLWDVQPQNVV